MTQIFKSWKRDKKVDSNWFLRVIFHKWISSKNRLILQSFYCKVFCFFFLIWILPVIKKVICYLLRERPKTYNEFYVFCVYCTNNTFQKQSLEIYLQIHLLSFQIPCIFKKLNMFISKRWIHQCSLPLEKK